MSPALRDALRCILIFVCLFVILSLNACSSPGPAVDDLPENYYFAVIYGKPTICSSGARSVCGMDLSGCANQLSYQCIGEVVVIPRRVFENWIRENKAENERLLLEDSIF